MKKFIFYITITSILLCGSANLFSTNKTFFNNLKKTINNNKRTTLGLSAAALTTLATIFGPKLYRKYKNYLKNLELSKDLSITKEVPKHFPVSSLPLIEPIKQEVPLIPKDTAAMPSNTTDTAVIQKPLYFNPNFLYKIKSLNEDKVFYIGSYENLLSNDIKKNTIDLCEANYEAIVAQENYTSRGFNFDKYFQSHENNIVMYNDKNETMGFIILSHQDNNVTVELLVVDEKYRGKGIAPFLIKTALEGMNYDNKENVDLITGKENRNKSARALYKKIFEKEELYYERVIKANHYKYSGKIKDTLSKINPKYILLEKMKNAQFEKIKNDKQEAKIDPVKYPQLFPNPPSKIQDDTIINGPNFPQMIKPNDKNNHEAFYVISHNEINKYEEIKKEVIKFFIQNLDEEEEITIPQINAIISKSYDNRQRVMYNSNGEIMGIIVYGEDHHRYGRTYVSETRKKHIYSETFRPAHIPEEMNGKYTGHIKFLLVNKKLERDEIANFLMKIASYRLLDMITIDDNPIEYTFVSKTRNNLNKDFFEKIFIKKHVSTKKDSYIITYYDVTKDIIKRLEPLQKFHFVK